MPRAVKIALIALGLLLALFGQAAAGPHEDALKAYKALDYETALRIWRPLATQGDPAAHYSLSVMYTSGEGVVQDYAEAVRWLRLAANQFYARAMANLGVMYSNGDGVARDYVVALMWLDLARVHGAADADEYYHKVASRMTQQQRDQAKRLFLDWVPSK